MPHVNTNGLQIYYEVHGAGSPVLLIAGLGVNHLSWALQIPSLISAGYQCIVFDSRDVGLSSQSSAAYTIREMAEDTVGLMNALGLASTHVLGVSLGGMIAQEIAINHPSRVTTLTLACTVANVDDYIAGINRAWKYLRPHCSNDDFALSVSSWMFTHRFFQERANVDRFLHAVRNNPFPQSVSGYQRQIDAVLGYAANNRLSTIGAPMHVIVGAEDILTPPCYSRRLADNIRGSRVTEIAAAGHAALWERPNEFNYAVIDFLQQYHRRSNQAR
jgi:pimeloyl-ACP methyl ester carboxylesterase